MDKLVLLSGEPVRYQREDGGFTLRYFLSDPRVDKAFNIVLQSHELPNRRKEPVHAVARELAGKQVRVTIEVID